jgi:hypothetical protein
MGNVFPAAGGWEIAGRALVAPVLVAPGFAGFREAVFIVGARSVSREYHAFSAASHRTDGMRSLGEWHSRCLWVIEKEHT